MLRYVTWEIPDRVFIDQCFTLEHNNGSVFDKFYDVQDVRTVLDAQAALDLDTLQRHASAAVRGLLRYHLGQGPAPAEPPGNWFGRSLRQAPPGALGCGNRGELGDFDPVNDELSRSSVSVRRLPDRPEPPPPSLTRYRSVCSTLHTSLGDVHLRLWPARAPYTVDNFVGLATGARSWFDPLTNAPGLGPFYDGTVFHRREPGFLIHGGDRLGTGEGSAGYRWFEEICAGAVFDEPFRVGMVNRAGPGSNSTGSQFFVTLAPAPHLDGAFAGFGEVAGDESRRVVVSIAEAPEPVVIELVDVTFELEETSRGDH
jgi:cyclophilin family peptidyl-prolyl cis-trans isomerase